MVSAIHPLLLVPTKALGFEAKTWQIWQRWLQEAMEATPLGTNWAVTSQLFGQISHPPFCCSPREQNIEALVSYFWKLSIDWYPFSQLFIWPPSQIILTDSYQSNGLIITMIKGRTIRYSGGGLGFFPLGSTFFFLWLPMTNIFFQRHTQSNIFFLEIK